MASRYQDIYPEDPIMDSARLAGPKAMELLTLEFFEADPGEMPREVFAQHHILVNLREEGTRVENWRGDEHRDFVFCKNEIVVTPAGVRSGWKWHEKSKVIVVTLEPEKLENFAQIELGLLLSKKQLKDVSQFIDEDITQAAVMLMEALRSELGSNVMFESFARIFLVKLVQKYGLEKGEEIAFDQSFSAKHYQRVLNYIRNHYGQDLNIESLATEAGLSVSHFSRLFKKTVGKTPHQFVMAYRIEQSKKELANLNHPMIDVALSCGFSDQAHFSRVFKQLEGVTPKQYRQSTLS